MSPLLEIPTMTGSAVLERLNAIGAGWRGLGCAVECGSWLGASAAALGAGLARAGCDRPLHLYDHWIANAHEVEKARAFGMRLDLGENLEARCRANVEQAYSPVVTHRTELRRARWDGGPIEFFILDAAKRDPHFSKVIATFAPFWVPGAVVGLLDFKFWKKTAPEVREQYRCQEVWASVHCGSLGELEDLGGVPGSSAWFFRVLRPLSPGEEDAPWT